MHTRDFGEVMGMKDTHFIYFSGLLRSKAPRKDVFPHSSFRDLGTLNERSEFVGFLNTRNLGDFCFKHSSGFRILRKYYAHIRSRIFSKFRNDDGGYTSAHD